jgi:2'-5' RNA ligase
MDKRLFIAIKILPGEQLLKKLNYLKTNLIGNNINWIPVEHFHQTLVFLGNASTSKLKDIVDVMKAGASESPSFDLELGNLGIFGSRYDPRVIWVGMQPVEKLTDLHFSLRKGLEKRGFRFDRQNFVPHLTLARIRKIENKPHFHEVISGWEPGIVQTMKVQEIVLYESVLGSRGASYFELDNIGLE